jgi:PAS domain S-box-containing protein
MAWDLTNMVGEEVRSPKMCRRGEKDWIGGLFLLDMDLKVVAWSGLESIPGSEGLEGREIWEVIPESSLGDKLEETKRTGRISLLEGVEVEGEMLDLVLVPLIAGGEVRNLLVIADSFLIKDRVMAEELLESTRRLKDRIVEIAHLMDIMKHLIATYSLDDLLSAIAKSIGAVTRCKACTLRLVEKEGLVLKASFGMKGDPLYAKDVVGFEETVLGSVLRTNKPLFIDDISSLDDELDVVDRDGMRSLLAIPISSGEEVFGVLTLYSDADEPYSDGEISIISALSGEIAVVIQSALLSRELERASEEISILRNYSESIIDSIPVGIAAVDIGLRIVKWNAAMERITGGVRGFVFGMPIEDVFPRLDGVDIVEELKAVIEGACIREYQRLEVGRDGMVVNMWICPLKDKIGDPIGALIIAEDITERVALENRLRKAERFLYLGEMAAGIAHEINNPIGIISAYSQMLLRKLGKGQVDIEEIAKYVRKIDEETARCGGILRTILNMSKPSEWRPVDVDIRGIILDIVQLTEPQRNQQGIRLLLEMGDELPVVSGDPQQLKQVFLNIVMNALQAMPNGGTLSISAERRKESGREWAAISVADTGYGIPEKDIRRIFEPFYTTRKDGSGLGLFVSYGIVQRHDGDITVESKVGEGSRFTVKLPAKD